MSEEKKVRPKEEYKEEKKKKVEQTEECICKTHATHDECCQMSKEIVLFRLLTM